MTNRSFGGWAIRWETLAMLWAFIGCAAPRQRLAVPDTFPQAKGFVLTLNNRHWLDLNVFVQHDGEASRVGLVTASSESSLLLPRWLLGDAGAIRIITEPIGTAGRYTTELLQVEPGQVVTLNVESVLAESNYSVQ